MSEVTEVSTAVEIPEGGKIVFADDVIATIAALAAADVEGIAGMSGSVVGEWTEKLGVKKNITKGIKVEVGEEETSVVVYVNVKYGYRIQQVCTELQKTIKNAIETMTGLRVVACDVNVQAVVFDKPEEEEEPKKEKKFWKKDKEEEEIEATEELAEPVE